VETKRRSDTFQRSILCSRLEELCGADDIPTDEMSQQVLDILQCFRMSLSRFWWSINEDWSKKYAHFFHLPFGDIFGYNSFEALVPFSCRGRVNLYRTEDGNRAHSCFPFDER
jgi:hypothetical protein